MGAGGSEEVVAGGRLLARGGWLVPVLHLVEINFVGGNATQHTQVQSTEYPICLIWDLEVAYWSSHVVGIFVRMEYELPIPIWQEKRSEIASKFAAMERARIDKSSIR